MSGLHILFHAPLKPPGHPVPSGDRTMARSLIRILEKAGHRVSIASDLRTHLREPGDLEALKALARDEISRLVKTYSHPKARPDLWLTYHNYYRAPDLIGPDCAQSLGLPYLLAEASHAAKRGRSEWAVAHRAAEHATQRADAHLCFTEVDRAGLSEIVAEDRLFDFPPFIDVSAFAAKAPAADGEGELKLVTVGMMRARAKHESYEAVAAALSHLPETGWQLQVIGDGPERADIEALFEPFGARVSFAGALPHEAVVAALGKADTFLWPGRQEAYGLVYLEAQAAGLPVIAEAYKAHRAVMRPDVTALVTPVDHPHALAVSIRMMMQDRTLSSRMGAAARSFVLGDRSDAAAIPRFAQVLAKVMARRRDVPSAAKPGTAADWPETRAALDACAGKGEQARFWLRDDDAVVPTAALERLLAICGQGNVPLVLASIPAYATLALAEMLREHPKVMVAPHGFSHTDHAGAGEKRSEFPSARSKHEVAQDIAAGWHRISDLFGEQALPLFVPPWNRIASEHQPALTAAGLAGLSAFGWPKPGAMNGLILRPTHLDIMQWGGQRRGRNVSELDAELAMHIRQQAETENAVPIGVLTHHLVHDETAWGVLESLLATLAEHPAAVFPVSS
jgi:glycosyltransferase involved in cell wall biosynthesis